MNTTTRDLPEPCTPVDVREWLQGLLIDDGQAEDARPDASRRN